ncbi:MAG: tetratricopeptide repeat protein, partial [Planctomycetota bacterium]
LADELDRFLDGRPIEARPIGRLEKVWRWTQRNRAVAVLAAAFLLALIGGLAGVTRQWLVAREAEQRANQSAELAQQQAEVAMGTLSEVISRIQRRLVLIPEARKIRQEMLELSLTGLQQVAGDLNNQQNRDEYLITAHFELGDLFLRLGGPNGVNATEDAIAQFDKAEKIAQQLAEKHPDATHAQSDLMYLYERRGNIENSQGNFEECIRYYKQALEIAERLAERDPNSNDRVRSLWFINFVIGTNEQLRFDFHAAARHYAAANAVLKKARDAELAFVNEPDTQVFFDDTQRRMRFCEMMPQALADESFALNEEPELAKELTYQRARTLAHRGQIPAAMKSLQLLLDIGDTNAGDQYNLACVYALCMRAIVEADDKGQAGDAWRECHRQALARIEAAWEGRLFDDAELCVILARDPDLEALRGNAEFEQLVEDILHDKAR